MLGARFSHQGAIFHVPYFRGAIPAVQTLAVENLRESIVIVEVDRLRLSEAAASMMCGGLLSGNLVSRERIHQ
jgi:hypothetical protein